MFCAGRELNDVVALQGADAETVEAAYQAVWALNEALYYLPKPTIVVVERFALGAGAGLLNWADFAIAEEGALIGYPEARIGFPPTLTAVSLIRSIGRKAAMDLLLTARNLTAEEAERIGLVTRVVPRGGAGVALAETLRLLLANSPDAIARTKRLVWKVEDAEYRAACAAAVDSISLAVTTREAREGVAAFVEKRAPRW
jgi:methylglutaconyl-CoA hydratase